MNARIFLALALALPMSAQAQSPIPEIDPVHALAPKSLVKGCYHNAFLFLARHAEIGAENMRRAVQPFDIGRKRRAILTVLALLDAHQHSRLFGWLYGMR